MAVGNKGGRPKKFTDEKDRQLKAILRMKPTLADCAAYLEVSEDTIERHIRRNYKCSYAEFRTQNMVHTRFGLIRTCIQQGNSGNTAALIFALKNLCGWTDRQEIKSDEKIEMNITKEDSEL